MNEIISESNNFLSSSTSFDSLEFQNNNINENISLKDSLFPSFVSEINKKIFKFYGWK